MSVDDNSDKELVSDKSSDAGADASRCTSEGLDTLLLLVY
jgi:hypothetical protein